MSSTAKAAMPSQGLTSLFRRNSIDQLILTKGDNNDADDIGLYNGPRWMKRKNIVGKVRG